ncbi:hypothetical protein AtEden1_Chr2g0234891 [Arabidopsis thaliana]
MSLYVPFTRATKLLCSKKHSRTFHKFRSWSPMDSSGGHQNLQLSSRFLDWSFTAFTLTPSRTVHGPNDLDQHKPRVNSFYELESTFVDNNNNSDDRPKSWCVGPLCLTDPPKPENAKPAWFHWLNRKREEMRPVLYVAFGTQTKISNKLSSSRN